MAAARTDFPPVRACLFDMDGLLLDTEDIYTRCINVILEKYGRPGLPWSIKARLQGRPGPDANALFHEWAKLPISEAEYLAQFTALQREHFPDAKPLPGVEALLANLDRTRRFEGGSGYDDDDNHHHHHHRVHVALATSSTTANFAVKTERWAELFAVFEPRRRVLGDDPRIGRGRGKPMPDIYLLALRAINDSLPAGERPVAPDECLVFEDSVPGVESGRRAGMRVVWAPHPMLKREYEGREGDVLAGRTGEAGQVDLHQLGERDDGWADYYPDLTDFPYEKYGIVVPPPSPSPSPPEVESDPPVKVP
ncbi:putative GS1 protein [Rosellinia necatrix]|uniref:Putative GS1 protein n=1 Tax=Rosellinia necatrix TaxID=77044 RepID=A0A1W2TTI8_ROSNE|nr:putative GS1 protein [Rosellinia necatrix]